MSLFKFEVKETFRIKMNGQWQQLCEIRIYFCKLLMSSRKYYWVFFQRFETQCATYLVHCHCKTRSSMTLLFSIYFHFSALNSQLVNSSPTHLPSRLEWMYKQSFRFVWIAKSAHCPLPPFCQLSLNVYLYVLLETSHSSFLQVGR